LSGRVTESHFFVVGIICYSKHNNAGRRADDECALIKCITLCFSQHAKYAALVLCCHYYSLLLSEGHAVAQLVEALRCTRKVASSIPDGVIGVFFIDIIVSDGNISWGVKAAGA
jgi:hypothetical protein